MKKSTVTSHPFINLIFVGTLTMLYAEVAAGSASIWFINPFFILYTSLLYAFHFLFYLNLALKTKRTSMWQLYLWGILFGLYEGPITQVIWAGYPSEGTPIRGTILGIAWFEFITIILFWHPIMSFITPLLTIEIFLLNQSHESSQSTIIPTHTPIFKFLRKKRYLIFLYIIIMSTGQLMATGFNLINSFIAVAGSMVLILISFYLGKRVYKDNATNKSTWTIYSFEFGKKGFISLSLLLLIYIYGFGTYLLSRENPGRWPQSLIGYLSFLLFIMFILFLLWKSPQDKTLYTMDLSKNEYVPSSKAVFTLWFTWLLFLIIFGLIPPIGFVIGIIFYLLNFLLGFIFFTLAIRWILKSR